jgi:hypothetical protein
MQRIYKYPLMPMSVQTITVIEGAKILSVYTQGGYPCIWALVDPDRRGTEERVIRVYGTGDPIADEIVGHLRFLGTVLLYNETLVLHVFEETKEPEQ